MRRYMRLPTVPASGASGKSNCCGRGRGDAWGCSRGNRGNCSRSTGEAGDEEAKELREICSAVKLGEARNKENAILRSLGFDYKNRRPYPVHQLAQCRWHIQLSVTDYLQTILACTIHCPDELNNFPPGSDGDGHDYGTPLIPCWNVELWRSHYHDWAK